MSEIHRTEVQLRFADTDALGHVNNANFATYAELARLDFFARVGGSVSTVILASLYIDFRRQVRLGESVHVDSWVDRIGKSSFTVGQAIFANDQLAADVKSVIVFFDYATQKSVAIPPEVREVLAPFART